MDRRTWSARVGSLALIAVLIGGLNVSAVAAPPDDAPNCPEAFPIADVYAGMWAEGWTVSQGRDAESFSVEVLGVLENGIGPGRDMIVVEASSPAIDEAGIWFGMSGSPVYKDGQLLGIVAFGMSFGPSPIAGLTAGRDLLNLFDYPTASTTSTSREKVTMSKAMARKIATRTHTTAARSNSMTRLATPLSVSGTSPRAMRRLNATVEREEAPVIPYAGSSASAVIPPTGTPPNAGQSFASVISYGDITAAGIGTTSAVCDDKAAAFGHPFGFLPSGPATYGANQADALTIVKDTLGGSYKLATVAETVGTVDSDRFAGIRALLGEVPDTVPITSTITVPDWSRTRSGETDVVAQQYVPFLGFTHALSNIDFIYDQISGGSAIGSFTIKGLRESGEPWALSRTNMYASSFDIAFDTVLELEGALASLFNNGVEVITFTEVDFNMQIEQDVNLYAIKNLLVSKNGGPFQSKRQLRVAPRDRLRLQLVLKSVGGGSDRVESFSFRVPFDARRDGSIRIKGGAGFGGAFYMDGEECFFEECAALEDEDGFADVLSRLQNAPANNQLTTKFKIGRRLITNSTRMLDKVIRGERFLYLILQGGICC